MVFKLILHIFLTVSCCMSIAVAYEQYATFYAGENFTGDSHTFKSKLPDIWRLTSFILSSRSSRIRGYWRAHTSVDYGGGSIQLSNSDNEVSNPNLQFGSYMSIRYAGVWETSMPSMTYYSSFYLNGMEKIITTPESNDITFQPLSLLSTGFSNWTMYTGANFDGDAICYVSTQENHFLFALDSRLSSVRSVVQGCRTEVDSLLYIKDIDLGIAGNYDQSNSYLKDYPKK